MKFKIERNQIKRALLLTCGMVLVILGIIGIFIPIMPTIPFMIIASVCFSHSSKKFYNMLMCNKWVGPHIKKYQEQNGIPFKTKLFLVVSQAFGIGIAIFFVQNIYAQLLLIAIAVGFAIYILSLKTLKCT